MALAHNGNLSNAVALRSRLELSGAIFHTTSDTEIIAYIITRERLRTPSIEEALSAAMDSLEGAYSLVLMSAQKLICARDPTASARFATAGRRTACMSSPPRTARCVRPAPCLNATSSRRNPCFQRKGRDFPP